MIEVTPAAVEQIRKSVVETDSEGMALRIAAKRKPDGSIEYAMGFDKPSSTDNTVKLDRIDVLIAPTSSDLLQGTRLDYVEIESGQFHFIFENPNDPTYVPPERD